ncbi:MAG: peptidase M28, partial [Acidobacteria bacterium]|nr:peptidase M28 [Acidobacteriota bacterium]
MRFTGRHRPLVAVTTLVAALALTPLAAQQQDKVDYEAIYKIKDEGFQRSQVMNIASWLTDVYGPRLTNSPGFRKAGEWAVKEMSSWGLANVKLEPWTTANGPFGRGWSNDQFLMQATKPGGTFPIDGMSTAWTVGTDGHVKGQAAYAIIETADDIARFKGQLKGKWVLTTPMREVQALWTPTARRYTDEELKDMQRETDSAARGGRG